jgi:hypothetical protein
METSQTNISLQRETDLLGLTRAEKKIKYWTSVRDGEIEQTGSVYDPLERIEHWLKEAEKYRQRIRKHVAEFEKIRDVFGFFSWVSSIINTIKSILKSLEIIKE